MIISHHDHAAMIIRRRYPGPRRLSDTQSPSRVTVPVTDRRPSDSDWHWHAAARAGPGPSPAWSITHDY
jgi:hypothetical protein